VAEFPFRHAHRPRADVNRTHGIRTGESYAKVTFAVTVADPMDHVVRGRPDMTRPAVPARQGYRRAGPATRVKGRPDGLRAFAATFMRNGRKGQAWFHDPRPSWKRKRTRRWIAAAWTFSARSPDPPRPMTASWAAAKSGGHREAMYAGGAFHALITVPMATTATAIHQGA